MMGTQASRALPWSIVGEGLPAGGTAASGDQYLLQEHVVDFINTSPGATWTAGRNERLANYTMEAFKVLLGAYMMPVNQLDPSVENVRRFPAQGSLPKEFDSRKAWPSCPSITHIRVALCNCQGHCGSCWAFGAVETLTDRFCILAHENVSLSPNDLVSCCGFECGNGCGGGWPYKAWEYFVRKGVVTVACDPYFDRSGCVHPGCTPLLPTPKCVKQCVNDNLWTENKHFADKAYTVGPEPEEIMAEIFFNGPVEVAFYVFEDFAYYKSGVYKHVTGGVIGGHAVKMIGWGTTEDGVDYWLIANSWNKSWGEDGYFRIVRGVNECNIEAGVVAGLPRGVDGRVPPQQVVDERDDDERALRRGVQGQSRELLGKGGGEVRRQVRGLQRSVHELVAAAAPSKRAQRTSSNVPAVGLAEAGQTSKKRARCLTKKTAWSSSAYSLA
eukprot:SM000068S20560  [mRNA]  locus=s68:155621:161061:+ [translate_table: standard]